MYQAMERAKIAASVMSTSKNSLNLPRYKEEVEKNIGVKVGIHAFSSPLT
jgi:flavin-dependent dehydrogenase